MKIEKEKRPTVGKLSTDLLLKDPGNHTVDEQMRENLTDYDKNLYVCAEDGKKHYHGDFFIVVITKIERLMKNVVRNYYLHRKTCPTPDYDQVVYHYHRNEERIEFLWTIPTRHACFYLKEHALEIPKEEHQLLQFVLDFDDGTLYKLCKKLNGEIIELPGCSLDAKKYN